MHAGATCIWHSMRIAVSISSQSQGFILLWIIAAVHGLVVWTGVDGLDQSLVYSHYDAVTHKLCRVRLHQYVWQCSERSEVSQFPWETAWERTKADLDRCCEQGWSGWRTLGAEEELQNLQSAFRRGFEVWTSVSSRVQSHRVSRQKAKNRWTFDRPFWKVSSERCNKLKYRQSSRFGLHAYGCMINLLCNVEMVTVYSLMESEIYLRIPENGLIVRDVKAIKNWAGCWQTMRWASIFFLVY